MQILQTHQIPSAIVDLIEATEARVYLVSPYVKPWDLLDRALARAAARGKRITFIVRADTENSGEFRRLNQEHGCEIVGLEHLHTKLYLNENSAIVGSMNLYDTSQRRNHEVGLLIKGRYETRRLREEVLRGDLLALPPKVHWPGRFHEEDLRTAHEMEALEKELAERGFCVSCGIRIALDGAHDPGRSGMVRCHECWTENRYPEKGQYRIAYCHYCGVAHDTVLSQPFHGECFKLLSGYATWRDHVILPPTAREGVPALV